MSSTGTTIARTAAVNDVSAGADRFSNRGDWLAAASLCHRELVRFLRQRHRIIGALATPLVFWLLIGAGMNRSFHSDLPGGGNYLQYFFPGTVLMVIPGIVLQLRYAFYAPVVLV